MSLMCASRESERASYSSRGPVYGRSAESGSCFAQLGLREDSFFRSSECAVADFWRKIKIAIIAVESKMLEENEIEAVV